jgi:hypothetical protein
MFSNPTLSIRPYAMAAGQRFAANQTFEATLDTTLGVFYGVGIELDLPQGLFADVGASRFKKTGQRAFLFNGTAFQLGVADTVTITPIEAVLGYRFHLRRSQATPFVAGGLSSYGYDETSAGSTPSEDLSIRKSGFLVRAGVDLRLQRILSISVDVQDTRVTGILGNGGISHDANEHDAGGIAARIRLLIGK